MRQPATPKVNTQRNAQPRSAAAAAPNSTSALATLENAPKGGKQRTPVADRKFDKAHETPPQIPNRMAIAARYATESENSPAKPKPPKAKGSKPKEGKKSAKTTNRRDIPPTIELASITELAPRIAAADHRRRAGKFRKVATRIGVAASLAGLTWLIGFSDYLALDPSQIEVTAEPESLVDLAAVEGFVKQHAGTPLARVRTGALAAQAQELPAVKQVAVTRVWPTGLNVAVESRVPAAAVATESGYNWIDATGIVVGQFPDNGGLIKLDGPVDEPRVLADMVEIWSGLPPELQEKVRAMSATTTDDIAAVLHSGQIIRWGSAEQLKLKIATAQALLNRAPSSPLFDVSSPALPITR